MPRRTNCRLRYGFFFFFFRATCSQTLEINFAGGSPGRIIPRGLSVSTRIRFYGKFLFRLRVPSEEHLFRNFSLSPIHARKRIFDFMPEITTLFFLLMLLSSNWLDRSRHYKGSRSCNSIFFYRR